MTDEPDTPAGRHEDDHFRFLAWLELPFPVIVRAEKTVDCEYRPGTHVDLKMTIRSDMLKLVTGSWAKERIQVSRWLKERQETKELPRDWIMEY